jgi:hypothetical protein
VVRNLPEGLPKNWPVEVTFEYAANGRLSVKAIVPGTQQSASLNLERAVGMSEDGIARWKRPIGAAAGFDEFEAMVEEVLSQESDDSDIPTSRSGRAGVGEGPAPNPGPSKQAAPDFREIDPPEELAFADEPLATAAVSAAPYSNHVVNLIGHIVAALLGLSLGYLILSWLRPEMFAWPW